MGGVFVDGYNTSWDISEMNLKGHLIDGAFIVAGAGLARAAAGSWRAYTRETPWKFDPAIGGQMPTRTSAMGDAVRARAPIPLINAGYIADDMISTSPALSYATMYSKERINTFDPFATLPGLSSNANMWAGTNGPDIW